MSRPWRHLHMSISGRPFLVEGAYNWLQLFCARNARVLCSVYDGTSMRRFSTVELAIPCQSSHCSSSAPLERNE
eukprot:1158891-Pelagomonas_calceolata.AAC.15